MKAFFPLVILSFACLLTHAQDKSFDLSNYKLPDIKRHSLDFNFNASGYQTGQNVKYWPDYSSVPEQKNISDFDLFTNSNLAYDYYRNTRHRIVELTSSLVANIDYQNDKRSNTEVQRYQPSVKTKFSGEISLYSWNNDVFIRLEPTLHFNRSLNRQKEDGTTVVETNTNSFYIGAGLGVGKGRVEPVSDLWQSYYILKKLEEQNLLSRTLQNDDVFQLAYLASKLKNERFFDFRLRKIAEMKSIDSLMQKEGLVRKTDVAYFSTINDYWNFANVYKRFSGNELILVVRPQYTGSWSKYLNQSDYDSQTTSVSPALGYENSKPINLVFDRAFWLVNSYRWILSQPNDNYPNLFVNLNAGYKLSYFPNFRTSVVGSVAYNGMEFVDDTPSGLNKGWSNGIDFDLQANYYISPQLRVSASANIQYKDKQDGFYRDVLNAYYNLSFSYAIF